jgi:hypothetical protein
MMSSFWPKQAQGLMLLAWGAVMPVRGVRMGCSSRTRDRRGGLVTDAAVAKTSFGLCCEHDGNKVEVAGKGNGAEDHLSCMSSMRAKKDCRR